MYIFLLICCNLIYLNDFFISKVINNASAISLTRTLDTDMKKYDLMHQVNGRGTFLVTKMCVPYLKKGKNPHILNLAPPLSLKPHWFSNHVAYTMAKYNMSLCALGWAEEFKSDGIAANCLCKCIYGYIYNFLLQRM